MSRRMLACLALGMVLSGACAAPVGGANAQPSSSPTSSSTAQSPRPGATSTPGAGTQVTAQLAEIDAAIRAADPHNLVTPVLDCINAKASQNIGFWVANLGRVTFYELVQSAAKGCGVTVTIQLGPGSAVTFVKPK